jgi:outer membrane protein assembly factor BamB
LQFDRRKSKATAVSLFLMFAMAVSLFALPAANAQASAKTYPYIGAMPNPVGVGQEVLFHFGISEAAAHPQEGWEGLTVTVTRPDGTTETLGPFKTDTTGGSGTVYVPTTAGTYYVQTHFPEQVVTAERAGRTYPVGTVLLAGDSEKLALNVTEEPRTYYPDEPLPTEYWTRPINQQFRSWGPAVASDWWRTPPNRYAPYNDAPETPHILWTTPLAEGGAVGGGVGEADYWGQNMVAYEMGDAYEGKFSGSTIINGVLYFNRQIAQNRPTATGTVIQDMISELNVTRVEQQVVAVDLKTGEELWSMVLGNNERLSFGQTMFWQTMNMYGCFSYLWTTPGRGDPPDTPWRAYDPLTGRWEYSMINVPSGTQVFGPNGEILIYTVDTRNGWMTQWNSTSAVYMTYLNIYLASLDFNTWSSAYYWAQRWRPQGLTINCSMPFNASAQWIQEFPASATTVGIDWNVTIPTGLPGSVNRYACYPGDRILGSYIDGTSRIEDKPIVNWGLSLEPGREGTLLFNKTWQPPAGGLSLGAATASLEDKVFTVRAKEIRAFFGFSMDTGECLWGPTESRGYMDLFMGGPSGESGMIGYGKLYLGTVAGELQAIDVQTGELSWTYAMTQPYTELMWGGSNWPIEFAFISDGKVYLLHTEHSGNTPLPRGAPFVCLNATTGEEIFRVEGLFRFTVWGGDPMIADSTAVIFSTYDNSIYAVGKGPSATTVSAGPKISVHGDSVLVEGMVTDVSPGTRKGILPMRFPNGVPAVADECIGEWMKYVYLQFERPADAVGVEVVIEVLDPNNNYYEVGRATSDASGSYSCAFTPEVPGKYTIIASFAGSEAYYGSFAETAINVEEAPAATPAPTPTPAPITDTYVLGTGIGIIIAIVIGFALLLLRKR